MSVETLNKESKQLNKNDKQEQVTEVDISPEVSMYNLLESYPYNLGSALSEYVDNAIQAFLDNQEKLNKEKINITITVDFTDKSNKKIIIEDDGPGITANNLKRAMKPAFKPDEQNLNEFGIGMKAASIWIGRKWTLINSYIDREDKNICQKIVFDLNKLIIKNEGIIPVTTIDKNCKKNGVIITIENIFKDFDENQIADAFLTLEENYQYYIKVDKILNLHLSFSENKSLPSLPDEATIIPKVLVSPKMIIKKNKPYWEDENDKHWKQDVEFKFNDKTVKGFVMCRETSSYKNPGVKIFRQKRLIHGTSRNPNLPVYLLDTANKHVSIRFYAELHLDGQKISNNKTELNINEKLFYAMLQEQPGVQDILDQATHYKANSVKSGKVEVYTGTEIKKDKSSTKEEKNTGKKENTPKISQAKLTDVLDTVIKNTKDLIVQNIAEEAKKLYYQSPWGFILCYRVIAEKVVQEKIKEIDLSRYKQDKIANKGIVDLIKWLSTHKKSLSFGEEWKSLEKTLNQISGANKFEITNLVGHGHYYPTKSEIDTLIINTQKLLEWAVSHK